MPPKRKHAEDAKPAASRSTRSSARNNTQGDSVDGGSTSSEPVTQSAPAAKKTKRAPTKSTKASASKSKARQPPTEDVSASVPKVSHEASASPPVINDAVKPKPAKTTKPAAESEPYSSARATELFSKYAEADDSSVIGPEGFERLCNDAEIPLEGALPLVLAWQLGASEMAKITKEEWDKGTAELHIACLSALSAAVHDLDDLLLQEKPPLKPVANGQHAHKKTHGASGEPYNRSRYYKYAADTKKSFNELYFFCFMLAKPPGARNIDMETASAFWSVLVVPRYPLMQDILDFINEKGTYKGVNKDLWLMVLEFCRTISPTLQDYEAEGAWPTMLDDFVSWKKSKMPEAQPQNGDDKASEHD